MSDEAGVSMGTALESALEGDPAAPPETPETGPGDEGVPLNQEINLGALLDVPVTLSVEIGRSKVPIKQLVSLNQGSVIELDREVSEPLDLLVNGKLMARGEVVVVDGQFGLRLVDIVSPPERLKNLT